jgi:two-component system, cell cycle response regulator DivK
VPTPERSSPLILLVDDFDDALEMYTEYFRYKGYLVVTAADGALAVTAAQHHRPDIIVIDVHMPVVNGMDMVRGLRSDPSFDHVPIVALTWLVLDGERALALRAGFDDVLLKPCLPDELLAHVRMWLTVPRQVVAS